MIEETLTKLFDFDSVRKGIVMNFGWLIHVSPEVHLDSIRQKGLIPSRDAPIPTELTDLVPSPHVLCMHPLGAKCCPGPACNTVKMAADTKFRMVTFAVEVKDTPPRVHPDWSNAWSVQATRISSRQGMSGEELATYLVREFGSFISYDEIHPEKLRVFCEGNQPANPLSWPAFPQAKNISTY